MRVLIVGAGPFGLTAARLLTDRGVTVQLIDRRRKVGGNSTDERRDGLHVHTYGMHIFHTSDREVWNFVNRYSAWIPYEHRVWAKTTNGIFPLPFGMALYSRLYGLTTVYELRDRKRRWERSRVPSHLEEWACNQIGGEAFELVVKGYTEKQWGRSCRELPASILKRLPVRMNWDTRYFSDDYQAMPANGYQALWEKMAEGIACEFGVDFLEDRDYWLPRYDRAIYTGPLDALWEYAFGKLQYRSLRFVHDAVQGVVQGCPVMDEARAEVPYTRSYEWSCLPPNRPVGEEQPGWMTWEYPAPIVERRSPTIRCGRRNRSSLPENTWRSPRPIRSSSPAED